MIVACCIIFIIMAIVAVMMYCLCKAAGDADKQMGIKDRRQ